MATEKQYQFFKSLYDEETARYSELINRAKIYFSIITFYLGALAFKADSAIELAERYRCPKLLYLSVGILFIIALSLTIVVLGIFKYERVCDPVKVIKSSGEEPPSDEDFFDYRIVDYAVASNRNSDKNNARANALWLASFFMLVGVIVHLSFYVCISIHA
jgi:hypothetical protein